MEIQASQHPKTEGCSAGGEQGELWSLWLERPSRSVPREKREPQAGPASGQSHPASKSSTASGEGVLLSESNTHSPVPGKGEGGLPGSQSVARAEGNTRNEGGPENACRLTASTKQEGRRNDIEVPPGKPGVGLAHSVGLIRKWLRAGILEEDGKVIHPQTGTPQGGIISPVLPKLMKELASKLRGTWNYYGLIGNYRRMKLFYEESQRSLYKWLNRRSQRQSLSWRAFRRLWERFHMPSPRIVEESNRRMPRQREMSFCQRLLPWPWLHPQAHARAS